MNKLCILTHGRTGSTLFINLLQNTNQVFALSEINQIDYTTNHYDVINQDGILYKDKEILKSIAELSYEDYIKQYLNIAEKYSDTFVYKIVLGENYEEDLKLKILLLETLGFRFLILTRNFLDMFVSNKKASITGKYSNEDYTATKIFFSFYELRDFIDYAQKELLWMINNTPIKSCVTNYETLFTNIEPHIQLKAIADLLNKVFNETKYTDLTLKDLTKINKKQNTIVKDVIYGY